jgi:hypothetical protein
LLKIERRRELLLCIERNERERERERERGVPVSAEKERDEASLLQERIREKKKEQGKSTCEAQTNRERALPFIVI